MTTERQKPFEALRQATDDLMAIAHSIMHDSQNYIEHGLQGGTRVSDKEVLRLAAKRVYANRRARTKHLPSEYFGEPAWDILLDLFITKLEGRKISITSASIASDAPATTALRYIELLEREDLVVRQRPKHDRRVCYLLLTKKGFDKVANCLNEERIAVRS